MAKGKKKISKQPPVATPRTMAKAASPPAYNKYLPFIITALFFALSFIGILNHEMWRDELQAWMDARDAHSLRGLFDNLKYEGHPALWYLFLYAISSFTHNPFWMQFFHILLSAAAVFLFWRYAPFSVAEKLLFTFGYFAFYEYNLIARNYALGLLLVVGFCTLYKHRQRYYLPIAVVLFLLTNASVFGLLLSLSLFGNLFLDYLQQRLSESAAKPPVPLFAASVVIILAGFAASYLEIRPLPDNSFPVAYPNGLFDTVRIKSALARIMDGYFALPQLTKYHFWNTNLFETTINPNRVVITNLNPVWPLLAFLVFALHFLRKPLILVLYAGGTLTIFAFFYYTGLMFSRYSGHYFILLVVALWLSSYYKEQKLNNVLLVRVTSIAKKAGSYLFILLLAVGCAGGMFAYYRDLRDPFSASKEAAEFLRQNKLDKLDMFGATDAVVSTLSGWLDRPIYYPNSSSLGTFIIWNKNHKENFKQRDIVNWTLDKNKHGVHAMLVVLHYQPTARKPGADRDSPMDEGMLTDKLRIRLLKAIQSGIVDDETFFIYLVDEINQ